MAFNFFLKILKLYYFKYIIRGIIRPTISYIKGFFPTPNWGLGLFSEGADWAMAQQSEVWVLFGVYIGYNSGRKLFLQK